MKRTLAVIVAVVCVLSVARTNDSDAEKSRPLRQYYSGKFGFYNPSDGLNNGLVFGIDGITEFTRYRFILAGAIDFYHKQNFGIFKNPPASISQQAVILLPIHASAGVEVLNVPDADTRAYLGAGGGWYLFFYTVDYRSGSGGILGGALSQSHSKSGGNLFASVFLRVLIGQIFLEPRIYLAAKEEETVEGGHTYVINPSGFAITLGFQYR